VMKLIQKEAQQLQDDILNGRRGVSDSRFKTISEAVAGSNGIMSLTNGF